MFKKILYFFTPKRYVICPMDDYAIYRGSLAECQEVLETLPENLYLIVKRKDLTPSMKDCIPLL
jgi:hypothetical protein